METPPGVHRAIGPATTVKLSVRDLLMVLGTVVALTWAAGLWANTIDARLKRFEERQTLLMGQVAALMDAFGIRQPSPPTASAYGPPKQTP